MPIKLGLDAKLYYKVGGQAAAAAWTLLGIAKDVTLTIDASEADVTTRANAGWKAVVGALKDASVECEMVYDSADAGLTALRTAFLTNVVIGIRVLDGLIPVTGTNGTQGLSADMTVTKFENPQPLDEALTVKVTIKPTYSATPPAWITL